MAIPKVRAPMAVNKFIRYAPADETNSSRRVCCVKVHASDSEPEGRLPGAVNSVREEDHTSSRSGHLPYGTISASAADPCAESGLIHTVSLLASAPNPLRSFQIANASGFNSDFTCLVSPGAIVTV